MEGIGDPSRRSASSGDPAPPPRPGDVAGVVVPQPGGVQVRRDAIALPTYLPAAPDKNPMFLEKRVYQGSNGGVYPLPFTDRIAEQPVEREWRAVWIENEFLRVLILPEIGGRIHALQDKTNGYDLIYNQHVIKPALVGLAGPWVSGGIEFNWPQHHRPATFLPVDCEIEEHADGSMTVWCSDHDPMVRMKGMHGICLHPGKAYVELKVRAYNRTPLVQTFLWWANVATRVHEAYQSFFPPDVHYVADHARRSMSEYPLAKGSYYGVNYGERGRKGIPKGEVPGQYVPPHCDVAAGILPAVKLGFQPGGNDGDAPNGLEDSKALRQGNATLGGKMPPSTAGWMPAATYAPNDLSYYANLPTPCSYMAIGSKEDFFGGYDYAAQAGLIHIANHHLSPGKKQWTWGNHEFGYAWDRNLTDRDAKDEFGPYIEIMAGVYTDNQPDFSFLQPGETKTWSQYWYPIQKIGPAQQANLDAALSLRLEKQRIRIGVSVTRPFPRAVVQLVRPGKVVEWNANLQPGQAFVVETRQTRKACKLEDTTLRVFESNGREIISYQPKPRDHSEVPLPATEPPLPADIASADELYITGLHLDQYRHATRCPTPYWREAVRRDPGDARCNNALGLWHLKRGEFTVAEKHFRTAVARLTRRNANPYDGEAYYNLGLCLRSQLDAEPKSGIRTPGFAEAYAAFYKATWNQAWAAAGYHTLAEMDCRRGDWTKALDHLNHSLRFNADNTRARDLLVVVLRRLEREQEARALLRDTLALDPLDCWARDLSGEPSTCDLQTVLDLVHDYARAGLFAEGIALLGRRTSNHFTEAEPSARVTTASTTLPSQSWGALPMVHYTLGWLHTRQGAAKAALAHFRRAATLSPDYCFPARLEEIAILEAAMRANARDARAPYYLGNLLYARRRHREGIRLWERAARLDPEYSVAWRNLGIGYFNVCKQSAKARAAYDRAFKVNRVDGRLLHERDQLWKRLGEKPQVRLCELERHLSLVSQRDDLSVELCALYNQTGQPDQALALVSARHFQPWEGGEGGALGQWVRAHLALGRRALAGGDAAKACDHFEAALTAPQNLGEARHLLANQSDVHYWLGCALSEQGNAKRARAHLRAAATFRGDFQEMSVRAFSELTYYSALAWEKLGQKAKAKKLLRDLLAYAQKLQKTPARIDYFATSLPTLLLFEDDLQSRQETGALFLQAQARLGLAEDDRAKVLLQTVLKRDPNHALAADLVGELADSTRILHKPS